MCLLREIINIHGSNLSDAYSTRSTAPNCSDSPPRKADGVSDNSFRDAVSENNHK